MAWVGICYEGDDAEFLTSMVDKYRSWLSGDRLPRMFGKNFILIYDSNTAREFLKKIKGDLEKGKIIVYSIPAVLTEFER